ncbi:hypothetical protein AMAG_14686 [Allomyces macrogynus ATCC 38327]|uniref:chitin synthase n=1 Tax=Allomyces macrogynus (strain ATCC 38327) TaxID=578462 RepID=A0A0L0T7N8_ALLM3|nr:hypothetical protein AMAG_14686 [Allomyces macrogynus ATCC 38327]|eukprot:KNE70564.1 hypothetical protein AMAG_14686 [Allomyces macrogynus ATCC 38327]
MAHQVSFHLLDGGASPSPASSSASLDMALPPQLATLVQQHDKSSGDGCVFATGRVVLAKLPRKDASTAADAARQWLAGVRSVPDVLMQLHHQAAMMGGSPMVPPAWPAGNHPTPPAALETNTDRALGLAELAVHVADAARATDEDQTLIVRASPDDDGWRVLSEAVDLVATTLAKPSSKHHNRASTASMPTAVLVKPSKLHTRLLAALRLLGGLGCVRTAASKSASRFGVALELRLDARHRLASAQILDYALDRAAAVAAPAAPQSTVFHILHYLAAGAAQDQRVRLHLPPAENAAKTLAPLRSSTLGADRANSRRDRRADAAAFAEWLAALKTLGLSRRSTDQVLQTFAAVLHLASIEFEDGRNSETQEVETQVSNRDTLNAAAELLGMPPEVLEGALLVSTTLVNGAPCAVVLTPTDAHANALELAQTLYNLQWTWLLEFVNSRLTAAASASSSKKKKRASRVNSAEDPASLITIVHVPGRPSAAKEYNPVPPQRSGAVTTLSRSNAAANDPDSATSPVMSPVQPMVPFWDALAERLNDKLDIYTAETVNAWYAQVTDDHLGPRCSGPLDLPIPTITSARSLRRMYSVEDAGAAVALDTVALFRNPDTCENSLVRDLFAVKTIATASAAKREQGHLPSKPLRAPSVRRTPSAAAARSTSAGSTPHTAPSMVRDLDASLDELLGAMPADSTGVHFVVSGTSPQSRAVIAQIARLPRHGAHAVGMPLTKIDARYSGVMTALLQLDPSRSLPDRVELLLAAVGDVDRMLGADRVWLSPRGLRLLESALHVYREWKRAVRDLMQLPMFQQVQVPMGMMMPGAGAPAMLQQSQQQGHEVPWSPAFFNDAASSYAASEDDFDDDSTSAYMSDTQSVYDGFQSANFYANARGPGVGSRSSPSVAGSVSGRSTRSSLAGPMKPSGLSRHSSSADSTAADDTPTKNVLPKTNMAPAMMSAAEARKIMEEEMKDRSASRKRWLFLVWFMTWWVPSPFLRWCGRMQDKHVQMAWREKLAIFELIIFFSAVTLFFIVFAGMLVCPRKDYFTASELDYLSTPTTLGTVKYIYTAVHGRVYNLMDVVAMSPNAHSVDLIRQMRGLDLSAGFPRTPGVYCGDFIANKSMGAMVETRPDFLTGVAFMATHNNKAQRDPDFAARVQSDYLNKYAVGVMAVPKADVVAGWSPKDVNEPARKRIIFNSVVYDLTNYASVLNKDEFLSFKIKTANGDPLKFDQYVFLQAAKGEVDFSKDPVIAAAWNANNRKLGTCMDWLFAEALVDPRQTPECLFVDWIMFGFSMCLVCIIGVKFIAALLLPRSHHVPENMDKFVMLQVPCYTEDEESMRKTLHSLATLNYDDKRKLLVVLCDGMIVGRGNDRPTPHVVLDILGVDPARYNDPPALLYDAVGDVPNLRQNRAQVFSGLYETDGHLVPFIVVVKVGLQGEVSRPGNRGKRDSQMVLMRFLNKLHLGKPMLPLELELRHQIENVIGVDPKWYEYMLMVDSDTSVDPDSVTQLVAYCMTDTDMIGVCGETRLSNEKQSFTTMIQVYEYFISQHLAKAFESVFGAVTCLPGCFCMYRIYSPGKNKPLLVHDNIINSYSDTRVHTLHKKNLLALGEDRFLTTLVLRTFPRMRTKFTPAALAFTAAPESFAVLVSQRRRWINSTLHNLVELMRVKDMCSFCCFSMRFIVLIDLVSTVIMPSTVVYLGYLIYLTVRAIVKDQSLSVVMVSFILLAAIYGAQAIVFLIKREFAHIVWMIIYLLAIPIFGFYIPLRAFWAMDDFSWGSTRAIVKANNNAAAGGTEGSSDATSPTSPGAPGATNSTDSAPTKGQAVANAEWEQYVAMRQQGQPEQHLIPSAATPVAAAAQEWDRMSTHSRLSTHSAANRPLSRISMQAPSLSPRMSIPSRPTSMMSSSAAAAGAPGFPNEDQLWAAIDQVLHTSDLMQVTKKQVRAQLEAQFGVDLSAQRAWINQAIDTILEEMAGGASEM